MEKKWGIDSVNQCTLWRHIQYIPGVNICMIFVVTGFTFFPYHVEDEHLASISFVCESPANIGYVVNPCEGDWFERAVASYMLSPGYLNDHQRGAIQIIAIKSTLLDPKYLEILKYRVNVSRVIQTKRHFAILGPFAHHRGFNGGYKISKAIHLPDVS